MASDEKVQRERGSAMIYVCLAMVAAIGLVVTVVIRKRRVR